MGKVRDFKKGDKVLHQNLQMEGTFIEYDWKGRIKGRVLMCLG